MWYIRCIIICLDGLILIIVTVQGGRHGRYGRGTGGAGYGQGKYDSTLVVCTFIAHPDITMGGVGREVAQVRKYPPSLAAVPRSPNSGGMFRSVPLNYATIADRLRGLMHANLTDTQKRRFHHHNMYKCVHILRTLEDLTVE